MREITDVNFKETLDTENVLLVVDFWAEWCGPCKTLTPIFHELSDEYESNENVMFCSANVDVATELPSIFGIRNIPTILFIKNGEVVDKQVGMSTKIKLQDKVDNILNKEG